LLRSYLPRNVGISTRDKEIASPDFVPHRDRNDGLRTQYIG